MSYSTRVPVIIKPEYTVSFERYLGLTFIHCSVVKWSPAVRKRLMDDFLSLVYLHDDPIYAVHEIGDEKHLKFLRLFGFKFVKQVKSTDLKLREIFVRSKHGN